MMLVAGMPAVAAPPRLLVMGDSLTAGYGLPHDDGFEVQLQRALKARGHDVVIVDAAVDVQREDQVWFAVGNQACPNRDFVFSDGLASEDDYTPSESGLGRRVGIDATRKSDRETGQAWPETMMMSDEILARIHDRWSEYGLDRQ